MLEYYTVGVDADHSLGLTVDLLSELGVTGEPLVMTVAEACARYADVDLAAMLDGGESGGQANGASRTAGPTAERSARPPPPRWRSAFSTSFSPPWSRNFPPIVPYFSPTTRRWCRRLPGAFPGLPGRIAGNSTSEEWRWQTASGRKPTRHGSEAFFAHQDAEKRRNGRNAHPVDDEFPGGGTQLPRCSGVALGVDRLVMHLLGIAEIDRVISFPLFE